MEIDYDISRNLKILAPIKERDKRTALSLEEKTSIFNIYNAIKQSNRLNSTVQNVNIVSTVAGVHASTVFNVLKQYKKVGALLPPKKKRDRLTIIRKLDPKIKYALRKKIDSFTCGKEQPTIDKLLAAVNADESLPNMKRTTFHKFVQEYQREKQGLQDDELPVRKPKTKRRAPLLAPDKQLNINDVTIPGTSNLLTDSDTPFGLNFESIHSAQETESNTIVNIKTEPIHVDPSSDEEDLTDSIVETIIEEPNLTSTVFETVKLENSCEDENFIDENIDSLNGGPSTVSNKNNTTTKISFANFGKHVSDQLELLPLEIAIILQQKIQNIIMEERKKLLI